MINIFLSEWCSEKNICITDTDEDLNININMREANELAAFIVKNNVTKSNIMEPSYCDCEEETHKITMTLEKCVSCNKIVEN